MESLTYAVFAKPFSLCVCVRVPLCLDPDCLSPSFSLMFPRKCIFCFFFFFPHIYRDCFPACLVFLIDSKANRKVHFYTQKKKRKENPNVNLPLRSQCVFFTCLDGEFVMEIHGALA